MKRIICYGIILFLLSSFIGLGKTEDVKINVEFNLNIGDWIINPTKYTGVAEIIYTGDENTSIIVQNLEMFELGNLL